MNATVFQRGRENNNVNCTRTPLCMYYCCLRRLRTTYWKATGGGGLGLSALPRVRRECSRYVLNQPDMSPRRRERYSGTKSCRQKTRSLCRCPHCWPGCGPWRPIGGAGRLGWRWSSPPRLALSRPLGGRRARAEASRNSCVRRQGRRRQGVAAAAGGQLLSFVA